MTSSLVGSEMCIRDSVFTCRCGWFWGLFPRWSPSTWWCSRRHGLRRFALCECIEGGVGSSWRFNPWYEDDVYRVAAAVVAQ
eukprot:10785792-Prorocentrum_lima.AAC.1